MEVTKHDIKMEYKNYGIINIPKGTRITHKTDLGYDKNYIFIDDFNWIDKNHKNIASILKHDAKYYGILISKKDIINV